VSWGDEHVKLRQLGGQIQPQRVTTMVLIPARGEAAHTVHRAPMDPHGPPWTPMEPPVEYDQPGWSLN
jgi:hypothetical protein